MALLKDPGIKVYTWQQSLVYETFILSMFYAAFIGGAAWLLILFKILIVVIVIGCLCPYPTEKEKLLRMSRFQLYILPAINIFTFAWFGWTTMPVFVIAYFSSLVVLSGKHINSIEKLDERYTRWITMKKFYKDKAKEYWDTQDAI